jgi:hypothetical protein
MVPTCPATIPAHKVCICHIPPGNEANRHNIIISRAALPAHLAHHAATLSDYEGACAGSPTPAPTATPAGFIPE